MGNNIEHRKFAERLRKKTGYKIVSLNHADEYVKYSDEFCDYAPFDIGPRDWISLIENAEYVCTDSFHGTAFSIIFNKPFIVIANKERGLSRFTSLLKFFGLENRIICHSEDIYDDLFLELDWELINGLLNKSIKQSYNFLNILN